MIQSIHQRIGQLFCLIALSLMIAPSQAKVVVYGGEFGDNFLSSFSNSVVNLAQADLQTLIGDRYNGENALVNGGEGSLGHVIEHAVVGCLTGAALGGDCGASAVAAGISAVYAGAADPEQALRDQLQFIANAELLGGLGAALASGGDTNATMIASGIAGSAFQNNYLTHAQFNMMETDLRACGEDQACQREVYASFTEISAEQQHQLAMCGADIACMAPHLQAIAAAQNHPLRMALLAARGPISSALQEFEYQVDVAYFGQTESFFDTGYFEGIYTPDYSAYFGYPEWAATNCTGQAGSACMARFQQDLQSQLFWQGARSGAQAFVISAGAGMAVGVAPEAALALRQCAANFNCWETLTIGIGEVGLGLSGATAGQTFMTVGTVGAVAGKLVLSNGGEILGVIDDLNRVLRPVSQTPYELGRLLLTTPEGVTGYLDDGSFVAIPSVGASNGVSAAIQPIVGDPKLQNLMDNIYKGASNPNRVGDGTLADAVRFEKSTGGTVGGKIHTIKAQETITGLSNWLKNTPHALEADRQEAITQIQNLRDALGY
jgi:Possible hemagglutinin (DUF637)